MFRRPMMVTMAAFIWMTGFATAAESTWLAGVSREIITPQTSVWLAG